LVKSTEGAQELVLFDNHPADRRRARLNGHVPDPASAAGDDLHVELPMSPEAPQIARSSLTAWAEREPVPPWRVEKLRLIASEVVTNAVRHSGAPRDSTLYLAASRVGCDLLVTVTDAGDGPLPAARDPDPYTGGYGMHIIDAEARRWGVERAEGTRVWFTA
jgi:anti-sigma regulatory factor (Ser/Thr protein kinase)